MDFLFYFLYLNLFFRPLIPYPAFFLFSSFFLLLYQSTFQKNSFAQLQWKLCENQLCFQTDIYTKRVRLKNGWQDAMTTQDLLVQDYLCFLSNQSRVSRQKKQFKIFLHVQMSQIYHENHSFFLFNFMRMNEMPLFFDFSLLKKQNKLMMIPPKMLLFFFFFIRICVLKCCK